MEIHEVLDHPNTFVLLQSHRLSLKDPQGGHLKTPNMSTPQIAIDEEITMIKDITKESCLKKDPHAATGRTPALIAETTHYLKMVTIRGDEIKKPVITPHLIRIHIAGIERTAGDIIQRHTHPTPAITEMYMITHILGHGVEGEAKTARTEATRGVILDSAPTPPTIRAEATRGAAVESTHHNKTNTAGRESIKQSI